MKRLVFLCFFLGILGCQPEQHFVEPTILLGHWNRINDAEGKETFEIWRPDFTGLGFTMQRNDTVFKEILSIVRIKEQWYLKVEGVNAEATLFKFTIQTDSSFVCENKKNPFPKRIEYQRTGNTLRAVISDDENSILFEFEKSF